MKNPHLFLLSVSLPIPSADTVFCGGLPSGAIEAIKAAYGVLVQILDPPRDGFNLTLKLNLSKLPHDEGLSRFIFKVIINCYGHCRKMGYSFIFLSISSCYLYHSLRLLAHGFHYCLAENILVWEVNISEFPLSSIEKNPRLEYVKEY